MNNSTKTVFIHVGTGKTGTSALQLFCFMNRNILLERGVLYPLSGLEAEKGHSHMSIFFSGRKKKYPVEIKFSIKELEREIEKSNHETVLISSEYFSGCSKEELTDLFSFFKKISASIKLIVYLRRQDNYIQSVYSQWVKMPLDIVVDCGVQEFIENRKQSLVFYRLLEKISDVFGKESVIVRPYEKQQFVEENIFSDFLNIVGLKLSGDYTLPCKNSNPSLGRDELEFKRLINCLPLPVSDKRNLAAPLLEYSGWKEQKEIFREHGLLSPKERMEIVQWCSVSNAKIAREYLGRTDGRLFYDLLPSPDTPWESYPGLSDEAAREIADFVAKKKPELYSKIKKAVFGAFESDEDKIRFAAKILLPGFKGLNQANVSASATHNEMS